MADSRPDERIGSRLVAERGRWPVPRDHDRIEIARVQPLPDRADDLRAVAARQIRAADAAAEQRVAGEHHALAVALEREAHRAGRVAGRVDDVERVFAELDAIAVRDPAL